MKQASNETPSASQTTARSRAHWPSRIIGATIILWAILVSVGAQVIAYLMAQAALIGLGDTAPDLRAWATLLQSLLLLVPLVPLALWWKEVRYRAVFRALAWAGAFALLLTPVHWPNPIKAYALAALQTGLGIAFSALLLLRRHRSRSDGPTSAPQPIQRMRILLAVAIAPVLLAPWLQDGALGAPVEALLNVLAALAIGVPASLILTGFWTTVAETAGDEASAPSLRDRILGGFVSGTVLLVMASAFGFGGTQLLILLTLPAAAWAAMALLSHDGAWLAPALLLAAAAAGPLLMTDPRELMVALAFALWATLRAARDMALVAVLAGWAAGGALLSLRRFDRRLELLAERGSAHLVVAILAIVVWISAGAFYALAGNPGFYGDRLFVIMREQVDFGAAPQAESVEERRRFVYERLVAGAEDTQSRLRQRLENLGVPYTPYYLVNGLEVEGGPLLRLWLQAQPEVDRVLYSPILRPAGPESASREEAPGPTEAPWNLRLIRADQVWTEFGVTGEGIVVGQSDSGVQWNHPELQDSYRGEADGHDYNWFDPWYQTAKPTETGGHGTHTLGIVLGNHSGVAPDAQWFGCANLARNLGSAARYLDCLQFMLAPFPQAGDPFQEGDPARGANVLNNSWGCPPEEGCDPTVLQPAVRALRAAGTFVVVSGGNEGPTCSSVNAPPATYDGVFSVGAVDRSGRVTEFSSRGPVSVDGSRRRKPDIVAPGQEILSAFPEDSYRLWEGTSMAGPHVTGVVALMWSANSDLVGDVATTERILAESASPDVDFGPSCSADGSLPNNVAGYGLVDAYAAVERALSRAAAD